MSLVRRDALLLAACVVLSVAYGLVLRFAGPAEHPMVVDVSNWGQVAASALASAGCWAAARRASGRLRHGWALIGAGAASWSLGQVAWTMYETVLDRAVPFPGPSDLGYLLFPVIAGWGLVTLMGLEGRRAARGRDVFDGLIIAGSLLMLSWLTVLGPVAAASGSDGWFGLALSLAYPVGDLVLGTLVLLALLRVERGRRRALWTMAAGLVCIAVADSTFVLLQATSSFTSSDLPSNVGWFLGFLVVGVSGVIARGESAAHAQTISDDRELSDTVDSAIRLSVPYVALVLGLGAFGSRLVSGRHAPVTAVVLAGVLVTLVLLRQLLAMIDNQRLISELADARRHLQHEATHDSLTGLPNRMLFADRLDRALARPGHVVTLLFCDLDGFKAVNDRHGHEVGDELLRVIAGRLLACVRDTDTVARLGGDEFAVVLDGCTDADVVAGSILETVAAPVHVGTLRLAISVSLGCVRHETTLGPVGPLLPDASERHRRRELAGSLLRHADHAMYAAKTGGRNQVRIARVDDPDVVARLSPAS